NKTYNGIKWWLAGTMLMAVGVILMPLAVVKPLQDYARVANPLAVLGLIFIYIGISRFIEGKYNRWLIFAIYFVFLISYYYFMFIQNSISARTVVVSAALAVVCLLAAYRLLNRDNLHISGSAKFTAAIFIFYACFDLYRLVYALMLPPMQSYNDQIGQIRLGFVMPIVVSTLWTFGFIIMLNQWLNTENRLEKEKMQMVFNASPEAALITRLKDGKIIDANLGFSNITGYARDEAIGKTIYEINLWDDVSRREKYIEEIYTGGNGEFQFKRKDGRKFIGLLSGKVITIDNEAHIISVVNDITARKKAEEALIESEETYRSILNATPDDITITDMEGNLLMVSPAGKKIYGYEPDYDGFIGTNLINYIVPEDRERAYENMKLMNGERYPIPNEYRGIRKDNSAFDIEVNSGFILNSSGKPSKMVFVIRDITKRKESDRQIKQLMEQLEIEKNAAQLNSMTDSLTGLANRRYFDEMLLKEFNRVERTGTDLSLIMLDVDYFKKFNDCYGHVAGDECLKLISNAIKTIIGRSSDVIARYGGEEFVVVLPDTCMTAAKGLAERIRISVEELEIKHEDSKISKYVTVSLGVATVHAKGQTPPDQLVAMADKALYSAKKGGRNRTVTAV
ncbi:MAG: diguanylate cyclase, partial [Clostridiales bacterium]|nr:diguanylate cyclase [Clostridiales bacterium]